MTGLVRFMGWLAVAVGVFAAVVPLAMPALLDPADAILITFVGIFAGIGLVALARLLSIAERIESNTNWFSVSSPGAARTDDQPAAQADEPAAAARPASSDDKTAMPEPWPVPGESETPAYTRQHEQLLQDDDDHGDRPATQPDETGGQVRPSPPTPPEIYDAERHPPAIEEWSYEGLRVMTLRDGSVAAEIDGMWYRFVEVQDLADFMQSGENA